MAATASPSPNLSLRVPNTPDAAGNPEELWSGQLTLLSPHLRKKQGERETTEPGSVAGVRYCKEAHGDSSHK